MSQLINNYPIFEGSQVLTSDQLNQLGAYLDQQNRLTRSKLIGMGIACGLKVLPFSNGLRISKGLGITSEGFLIQIGRQFDASHYRPYSLPEGVSYKPFTEEKVELFELLSEQPADDPSVKKLNSPANFLNNKFVLLFLEIFDRDLKSCLGNACDDKGIDRILTLRRLVVSQADLNKILKYSQNVEHDLSVDQGLPLFPFPKPRFRPDGDESLEPRAFIKHYQETIKKVINKEFWEVLAKGYKVYEPILEKSFAFKNPFAGGEIQNKIQDLMKALDTDPKDISGIQYLYDFFKELCLAWEEYLQTGESLWFSCPTDPSLFPLHMMLGRAISANETAEEFYRFRHGWIQPPIFNDQRILKETLAQRYRRLVLMIETFELAILVKNQPEKFPVKITPSREKYGKLGERSLPYYYAIKSKGKSGSWFSLEQSWPDPQERNLTSSKRAEILGYDNQPDTPKKDGKFIESPLGFDLESYPFLRIEGHLDKPIEEAKKAVSQLIRSFNLDIEVEALHIDKAELATENRCHWHDLQEEYVHHRLLLHGTLLDIKEIADFVQRVRKEAIEENLSRAKVNIEEMKPIEWLNEWLELLPTCLADLDWSAFQAAYKRLLQGVLDFLLVQNKLIERLKLPPNSPDSLLTLYNGILHRISPVLYRLIDLVYFTKLKRLYLSYLHRVSFMANSKQFAHFLKANPGMTHEAGAYRGGTFFLLYHSKSDRVIGDFSLKGKSCDCACMDACENFDWGLLPPFARPDFAITLVNRKILVEVTLNDLPQDRSFTVTLLDSLTKNGGRVEHGQSNVTFIYTPPENYTGIDHFEYMLLDTESKKSDRGKVTIHIRGEASGCYSAEILACWNQGQKYVQTALRNREIPQENLNEEQAIQALLASLRESKGFTLIEMTQGVLEEYEAKQRLLTCLGLPAMEDDGKILDQRILDYQAKNCGPQENECKTMQIKGTVTDWRTGEAIRGASVSVKGTQMGTKTSDKGTFELDLPSPGQTIVVQAQGYLEMEEFICSQDQVTIPLTRFERVEANGVAVDFKALDTLVIRDLAASRNLAVTEEMSKDKMIEVILADNPTFLIKEEELPKLKNDSLKSIAEIKDIRIGASDNKTSIIDKMIRR
ncbi:carboxypeptidase-like regulatory domain-containing protein [Algoriphagus confluentis]|uniref:Carboxypeptidase regulatory-like domain-containing protein n=1 Tax=Algoriphagus confluentis TaxID=1697556 RepID=A0ABQ6PS55_9BACT|nr:hypothetical protein Aconfl_26510 [Algoriphagus confluentis]